MPRAKGEGPEDPRSLNLAKIVFRLIFEPRGIPVKHLMNDLEIKDRTFRAYRQTLQDMPEFLDQNGESLITVTGRGENRRLCLKSSPDGPLDGSHFAVRFAALHYARQTFGFMSGTHVANDVCAFCDDYVARVKNQTYVYNSLFREGHRKFFYLPWAPKDYSGRDLHVTRIIRALADNRKLKISYESSSGNHRPRTVLPLTLVMWKSALYLIVMSDDRGRTYNMAVDRMRKVDLQNERFIYPALGTYDPEKYLDGGFGIFVAPDARQREFELVFEANPDLQRQVRERLWHKSQRFEILPDGRMRMSFTVTTDVEVWPWIRSFGDAVDVVRPDPNAAPHAD